MVKSRKSKKKMPRKRCATQFNWRRKFLESMRVIPVITHSARAAGISRRTVLRHRKLDPSFDAAIEAAVEEGIDNVEARAFVDAIKDNTTLKIFILKSRRRTVYGDQPAQIIDLEKLVEMLAQVPATIRRTEPVAPKRTKAITTGGNGRNGGRKRAEG